MLEYNAAPMTCRALLLILLALGGCNEECVDQFDCLKVGSKSTLTCEDGRCVVKTVLPTISLPMPTRDAGVSVSDGGLPPARLVPGEYVARLSGNQQVPPVGTTATGTATFVLRATDAGTSLTYSLTTDAAPVNVALMLGTPAGRQSTSFLRLNDGGVTLPFTGALELTQGQALAISRSQAAIIVTSAARPFGEIRGQIVPKGAALGFTQLVRSSDRQYGGGGQLILETDGGFIPIVGSYFFDWTESGPVAAAALTQSGSGSALLPLPLNATRTGSAGSFDPLSLLLMVRDAGVIMIGTHADGGEAFRGDLTLR